MADNVEICKTFRRIDAAVHALRGKEVHWNKQGLPCEVVRTEKGTFSKQEIPTVFPHWSYKLVSWASWVKRDITEAIK